MFSSRSFSQLTAGAALCTTSLAAAGGPSPLTYSTVNSWSVNVTLNSDTVSGSSNTPSGLVNSFTSFPTGSPFTGAAQAYYFSTVPGSKTDLFGWRGLSNGPAITTSSAVLTFSVTVTRASTFFDLSAFEPMAPVTSWTANSNALSNGDVLAAGTYTFSGSGTWSGNSQSMGYGFFLGFIPGGGGGVPLPGAAGLAACGLVGLSRRRRR